MTTKLVGKSTNTASCHIVPELSVVIWPVPGLSVVIWPVVIWPIAVAHCSMLVEIKKSYKQKQNDKH